MNQEIKSKIKTQQAQNQLMIRVAGPEDRAALLDIYRPYVQKTAITFEYDVPSEAEFGDRVRRTLERYPYLAAILGGQLVGYAYAGPLHPRAAYAWSAETSIYVRRDLRRLGAGRALYRALEACLARQGILNANACIAYPAEEPDPWLTRDSAAFHRRMGYRWVGEFHRCGYKFSRWYDMVWMEKDLAPHPDRPAPVRPFPAVREELEARLAGGDFSCIFPPQE